MAAVVRDVLTEQEWGAAWTACQPGTLIVLDFFADWAEPCKQMDALFAQLSATLPLGDAVQCWRVSADGCAAAVEGFKVEAVPSFVCVRVKEGRRAFDLVEPRVSGADVAALAAAFQRWGAVAKDATAASAAPGLSLDERLKQLVSKSPVMLFMKGTRDAPQCGFSRTMVGILNDQKAAYETFDILADDEVRQGLKAFSNWPTYPQLYVGGELVGGLDIVKELLAEGELADALTPAAPPSLDDRLKALIESSKVMLFMKGVPDAPECGFSRQTVELLRRNEVEFGSFNILADEEVRQGLKTFSNWPTYPQLYSNGTLVGGLDILKELEAEGELKTELA